ncbi:hypothetical protein ACVR0O_01735 [Streptococcus caviae]|uniref:hypothetical protein n=1 Tax=Streptococcus sp. 'caviae' TaxID=1915004 RepID=UPI00094B92F7|nr:hypothetical protein [Streptococcus sp. 'caviae']OLN84549.1 hypothetical protein BMI76_00260 [Streptococcus sp. 'caviae']
MRLKQDLDNIFDQIIKQEEKMITNLQDGEQIERNPSYFKDMKMMYQKEWEGIRNPNNIFIPFILVSMESVLRRIIHIEKNIKEQPTAVNILDKLLSKESPLQLAQSDIRYQIWQKIRNDKLTLLGFVDEKEKLSALREYLIKEQSIKAEDMVEKEFDRNGYFINLKNVLIGIRDNYYSREKRFNNSYRNLILHANRLLIIENNKMFGQMLEDYCKLISSVWSGPITSYTKEHNDPWLRLVERFRK